MSVLLALLMIGAFDAFMFVVVAGALRRASLTSPGGIARRLTVPDDRYTLRVRTSLGTWDPARPPGVKNRIREAGTAVYRRQTSPDGDAIHLDFTPTRGSMRQTNGPVPKLALPGTAENRRLRLGRAAMYGAIVALMVLGLIGASTGLLIASGRSDSARVAGVLFGWFAGTVVFSVTVWSLMIGRAVRDTFRQQTAGHGPL